MFCDVRVCYKQMTVAEKAMHKTSKLILQENVLERLRIMTDTQAIDVVTFAFKGTRVRCFFSGSTDYQIDYY